MPSLLEFNRNLSRSLYQRRRIIWALAIRELKVRYKGSVLGFFWTFMNPLLLMVIYTVVFTSIFKTNIPHYEVYVFSGILLWNTIGNNCDMGSAWIRLKAIYESSRVIFAKRPRNVYRKFHYKGESQRCCYGSLVQRFGKFRNLKKYHWMQWCFLQNHQRDWSTFLNLSTGT